MAVESISSLFSENPITTLTDDYMFEVAGDAGAGVVSGATKLATIKANVLGNPVTIGGGSPEAGFGLVIFDPDNGTKSGIKIYANNLTQNLTIGWAGLLATQNFDIRTTQDLFLGTTGLNKVSLFTNSTIQLNVSAAGLLQFLGETASFPALKSIGTQLKCRLADDSGDAPFSASIFTGSGSGLASVPGSLTIDSGWVANSDGGDKTLAIATTATRSSLAGALNLLSAGVGDDLYRVGEKVKAIETALVSLLAPNS